MSGLDEKSKSRLSAEKSLSESSSSSSSSSRSASELTPLASSVLIVSDQKKAYLPVNAFLNQLTRVLF